MFDLRAIYIIITTSNSLHKSLPIPTISNEIISIDNKLIPGPKTMVIDIKISSLTYFQIIPIVNNIHANNYYVAIKMF